MKANRCEDVDVSLLDLNDKADSISESLLEFF